MKSIFFIRFTGKYIKPETFTLEDLKNLLGEVQFACREFGSGNAECALVEIKRTSACYGFSSYDIEAGKATVEGIHDSLGPESLERTVTETRIRNYFKRLNAEKSCKTLLYDDKKNKLVEFKDKVETSVPGPTVNEYVTIQGTVVEAGGTRTPRAVIQCMNGKRVTAYGSNLQIQELGQKLYSPVKVSGSGEVNTETGEKTIKLIMTISEFKPTGIATLFKGLREQFGDCFGDDVNPLEIQNELRDS